MARFAVVIGCAALAVGCAASASNDADGHDEGALLDTAKFVFAPGAERVRQHKGPIETTANQRESLVMGNAYWLARLSQLAYRPEPEIRTQLTAMGLASDDDHFRFFENRCTDTQAFYVSTRALSAPLETNTNPYNVTSPDVAALVFRGTEESNWTDLRTDLATWNRPGASPMGNVHAGFMGALKSVWQKADDESCATSEPIGTFLRKHHQFDGKGRPVRRGAELYLTGHSLGGALAGLALTQTATEQCEREGAWSDDVCFREYTPVSALITFGSPRLGDRSLADTLARWMQDRTPIFRFVQGRDPVVSIPKALGFYHPGFDGDESTFKVHVGTNPTRMAISSDVDPGSGSLIDDHRMHSYLPALEALAGR